MTLTWIFVYSPLQNYESFATRDADGIEKKGVDWIGRRVVYVEQLAWSANAYLSTL